MQFLVIARDGTDENALERRLAARDAHIALVDKFTASGNMLIGAAILNEKGEMAGSVLMVDFESLEELKEKWLSIEPYVTGDVWEEIEIDECRLGPSFQERFKKAITS